jgi:hypothetical protein
MVCLICDEKDLTADVDIDIDVGTHVMDEYEKTRFQSVQA